MIKYKDECVGCSDIGLPCRGSSCPYQSVKHLYCDKCRSEQDRLYIFDGEQLCGECLLSMFDVVEVEEE